MNKIDPFKTMPMGVHPKHLLWALCFLTVYDTEHNSSHRAGIKWTKRHIKSGRSYLWKQESDDGMSFSTKAVLVDDNECD